MDAEGAVGLGSKGIEKFLAYEIPLPLAKQRGNVQRSGGNWPLKG
jgi:hypothetical protein